MTALERSYDKALRDIKDDLIRLERKAARMRVAASIGVVDTGGLYGSPGTLTLEQVLALIGAGLAPGAFLTVIGGGKGTVNELSPSGPLGATQLVDLALGNYHFGELGEDCELTTTGWTDDKDCQIVIELDVAGFTPTFTGFSWIGGTVPTWPASGIVHVAAFSRDAGTTIYAAMLGSGGGSDIEFAGHYELLMDGGSPPEPIEDGSGTDWLYVWVP